MPSRLFLQKFYGIVALAICIVAFLFPVVARSQSGIAWGSINNFDTVNDTGKECHGFEIDLEDCHSTDISYTYDYNHYGTCKITEDNSIPAHPKCIIRWESKKNPDGSWAAYTAIPSGPIAPTDGHMFTNPSVNFGGEHFGVGYNVPVGAVTYNWLVDDGAGNLVKGGAVQVSTPTFVYYPPAPAVVAPPQVQAVIVPPAPEVPPTKEFGDAVWVKEIRTTAHNSAEVKLRDLVSADPDHPEKKNWKNGEADEVEVEWQLLQKDYGKPDGGVNNEVPAAAEGLPNGDEVVTRRYEFFKYVGPLDTETGEAMAGSVGPDGIHGVGVSTVNGVSVDLSTVEVVGEYAGAQMAAADVASPLGLVDHVAEGRINNAYVARTLVLPGGYAFNAILTGTLPAGMSFDAVTGILSGTPTESGRFDFNIAVFDGMNPDVTKNYILLVAAQGEELPPTSQLDTTETPVGSGYTSGDGLYAPGTEVSVDALPAPGYHFVQWTDNGVVVSSTAAYTFVIDVNHSLLAHFAVDVPVRTIAVQASPGAGGAVSGGGNVEDGAQTSVTASATLGYAFTAWTEDGATVSTNPTYTFTVTSDRNLVATFTAVPVYAVTVSANPIGEGVATGGGSFSAGSRATVSATANPGYVFMRWTLSGTQVSTLPSYTFTVNSAKNLVANFVAVGVQQTITTSANPTAGGTTSGGGAYATGDSATVEATAYPGYEFSKWQEGGTTVSTSPTYTFTVGASRNLVARFNEAFVVQTLVSPPGSGSTEMDSLTYKTGEKAVADAFPAGGYHFVGWTENGVTVSGTTSYSFKITGNRTLVANFASDTLATINAAAAPSTGGTVSGDGSYGIGDSVSMWAEPAPGYGFVNWTEDGLIVSTDPGYTFTVDGNHSLVAHFAGSVPVAVTASPADAGTVSGSGDYGAGATASINAIANAGFVFDHWTEDGAVVSTLADYHFTVTGSRNLVANFRPEYNVDTQVGEGNGAVEGGGTYKKGTHVTLTAVPQAGYRFEKWTQDGVDREGGATIEFDANEDHVVQAHFSLIIPDMAILDPTTGTLQVSWPSTLPGWTLQETTNVSTGPWINSNRQIVTSGTRSTVIVPKSEQMIFFRLIHY